MTFIRPQRRKREKMGTRTSSVVRCQGHLQWTGGNACVLAKTPNHNCSPGRSHAHHVQSWRAIEGGMGMKVGDDKVVPLCSAAHDLVHTKGQKWLERVYSVDLEAEAINNWKASPHRIKYEQQKETP